MLTGKNNEEKIWNYLTAAGLNACGTAGLMGNLYAESGLSPTNLQNTFEKKLGYTDAAYTAAVDEGSYTNFARDSAGYGLAQWTYWSRKQNLLDYARDKGKSVGDLETQLEFLLKELTAYGLLDTLKSAAGLRDASDLILLKFEKPAGQSEAVKARRAGYGQTYFNKYAKEDAMKERELRAKIVAIAQSYIGYKESDGSHKAIIDLYNSHKPLARGYKVQYTDAWCATFGSAVAIAASLTDIIPTECGCGKQIELFQKLGSWQENDAYVPSPGDYIFYDWQDTGAGDNTGAADHVGIVEKVSGQTVTVIEGNYSDAVKRRTIAVNGRYIRGYGVPNYAGKAAAANTGTTAKTTTAAASSVKVDAAKYRLDALAGAYKTTADLNLRAGAGTAKTVLAVVPEGAAVRNYGYYNEVYGKKWLYVQYTAAGKTYTGYCSAAYLTKN